MSLPREGIPWIEIVKELRKILRELPTHFTGFVGSMTTVPHPLAKQVFLEFMEVNANDIATFRRVRELELEAVRMLGEILGCRDCVGMITTGGSEANLAALYLAREHGYEVVYAPLTAHDSVFKAAKLLRMRVVIVEHRGYRIDVDSLEEAVRSNGPGIIVATVGTTGFGTVDPVEAVSAIAREHGCVVHVDAAFGGFVAPFLYPERKLGFSNDAVVSATMDPHKLGLAPIPCGGLVVRDEKWFEPLVFEAKYMPSGYQVGLLGTRSAGSIAAAWAMLKHMGWRGYEAQARELMRRTRLLTSKCAEIGLEPVVEPEVPVVCIGIDRDVEALEFLAKRGVYLYRCGLAKGVRVVIGPHVDEQAIGEIVEALRDFTKSSRSPSS